MTILNITHTSKYDFNFIFLGQLKKIGIIYHNHFKNMIFKNTRNIINLEY